MSTLSNPLFLKQEIVRALQCGRPGCPCIKGTIVHCPAHDDAKPSLTLAVHSGHLLVHCHAGCSQGAVIATLRDRGLWPPQSHGGLTLDELAAAKKLPVDFLQSLGLQTDNRHGVPCVRIPYMDAHNEAVAIRYRTALDGPLRFLWRRGDKPTLYGLWQRDHLRKTGWLLLVEGESDCWTAWSSGLPALGIPGKSIWRHEWTQYCDGVAVFVWLEPGAIDLVERLSRHLLHLHVIIPPDDLKDLSDAHLRGEDVAALVERLKVAARPAAEVLHKREDAHRQLEADEALRQSCGLLDDPHFMDRAGEALQRLGLAGDVTNARLLYLAITSRLLERPVNVAVDGPSAAGKSYLVSLVSRLFPPEATYCLTASSERFLAFAEEDFRHRVIVIGEAAGLHRDRVGATILRTLVWEGHMVYQTVEKTARGLRPRQLRKPGPTGFITTSTKPLDPELATRLLTITIRDDPAQSRLVVLEAGRRAADGPAEVDVARLIAAQRWLTLAGAREAVVPFGEKLAELTNVSSVRVRRDFTQLLALVKSNALLYQQQRRSDAQGRVVATVEDYAIVYGLTAELFAATLTDGLTAAQREAVDTVLALCGGPEEESQRAVSVRKVASHLGIDRSAAYRRLTRAVEKGYVINLEDRRGRPARYVLGDALPAPQPAIPTPEALAKAFAGVCTYSPQNHCTTAHPETITAPNATFEGVQVGVQVNSPAQPTAQTAAQVELPVQPDDSRDLCSGAVDPGGIGGAQPRSPLPPFEDYDRRAVVVRMGENLGYKKFEFRRGVSIAEGEEHWRTFAATASGEDITLALRALEACGGPGDG